MYIIHNLFPDTFEKLAQSHLIIETFQKKSGKGLYKGLSPMFDLLVEKYFEISDPQNPDGVISRVRDGKTARYFINLSIPGTL